MCKTFTNKRSGESIVSSLTNAEAAAILADNSDDNQWLWFWIHKFALEHQESPAELGEALRRIQHMFLLAIGYGLKRPQIRVVFHDRRYKLYLSRRGTLCIKSGRRKGNSDQFDREEYVGCVWQGKFLPAKERTPHSDELAFLDNLQDDPLRFLAECSRDMNRCCYCNMPLEDPYSKEVGYGPVCAKHWGLPWGAKASQEKIPAFADEYDSDVAEIMARIQTNPRDLAAWSDLREWLVERGLPPCSTPSEGVTVPAA